MINGISPVPVNTLQENDKRSFYRFKAKEGLCVISYIEKRAVLCDVLDICEGGFSFLYLGTHKFNDRIGSIKIITIDGKYTVSDIPVKIVSNIPYSQTFSYSNVQVRRIGAAFEPAGAGTTLTIHKLLKEYTDYYLKG